MSIQDSVKVILQPQVTDALQRLSTQRPFWESPLILTFIAAVAVIIANALIARRSKIDTLRNNKITLHLAWATDFRRAMTVYLSSAYQVIEDYHKMYLVVYQSQHEDIRTAMNERGFVSADSIQRVKDDLRSTTMQESSAVLSIRFLLDLKESVSYELSGLCAQIHDLCNNSPAPPLTSLQSINDWKDVVAAQYGVLAKQLTDKAHSVLSAHEIKVLQ